MGTIYQSVRRGYRFKIYKRSRVPAFKGRNPFKSGTVFKVRIMKPKKPNSANRKITKVEIKSVGRYINCYIPGTGHSLGLHNHVLVRGGRVKDLPGIRYHLVRGKWDFSHIEKFVRVRRRSKYGNPTNRMGYKWMY